jgi:type I restriction enzyme S subunit
LGEVLTERREIPTGDDIALGRVRVVEKISFESGEIQFRNNGSTRTGMILARPGDLLVSGINAAKGAIAIFDPRSSEPVAATIHYGAYFVDAARVDARFLWWLLRSRVFQDLLRDHVPGGIKTELKAKRLLAVPVPLPRLAEQQRLSTWIAQVNASIGEAVRLRSDASEEAESVLAEAIDSIVWGQSPVRGEPIDQCCLVVTKGTTPKTYGFAFADEGIPFLRAEDVPNGVVEPGSAAYFIDEAADSFMARSRIQGGDVLVTIAGTIGRCGFVPADAPPMNCNQAVAIIRPRPPLLPEFLAWTLRGRRSQIAIRGRTVSSAISNLSLGTLRGLVVPVPPEANQRSAVRALQALSDTLGKARDLQVRTLTELSALKHSVVDGALRGDL